MNVKSLAFSILSLFLVASCNKSGEQSTIPHEDAGREGFLNFYAINDYHGRISNNEAQNQNGISKVSAFLNEQKYDHELEYVFLSSGDLWQDTYESNANKGACLTEAMEEMGCEAMALGNHEFDWGLDTIKYNRSNASKCDYLGANIYYFDNETNQPTTQASDLASPYTIVERNGYKIGVIGIIGENQITSITSTIWENITFVDPTEVVTQYSNELRQEQGCDLVILLSHASSSDLSLTFKNTVTATNPDTGKKYIDAAFTAHTHVIENVEINGVPFVQGQNNGDYVSRVEFDMTGESPVITAHETLKVETDKTDPKIDAIVNKYITNEFKKARDEEVCTFTNLTKLNTTNAGRLLAYATYQKLKAKEAELGITITAVLNNGGRSDVTLPEDGKATREMLFNITPFTNETIIAEVTGANLNYARRNCRYYAPVATKIDVNQKYYIACIDYVLLHKSSARKYDTFSQYDGNVAYKESMYPDSILYEYCKGKTIDKSLFSDAGFGNLS